MNDIRILALLPASLVWPASLCWAQAPAAPQTPATRAAPAGGVERELAFIEIPDLPKLLEAYSSAPFAQMVADPELRASVGALLDSAGIEMAPALALALEELGLPAAMAASPLATLRGLVDQVDSAAFSIALNGEAGELSDSLGKTLKALTRIGELEAKVAEHAERNQGYPPGALEELGLPAVDLLDPWGHPFALDVDLDSLAARVSSLGADGQPGGEGFAADLASNRGGADLVEQILPRALGLRIEIEFVEEGGKATAHAGALALAAKLGWETGAPRAVALAGVPAHVVDLQDPRHPGRAAWLIEAERRLVLGYGEGTLERALERGREVRRAAHPTSELTELAQHLEEARGATVVQGWMRLDALEQLLAGLEGQLESQHDLNVQRLPFGGEALFRMRLDGERFVTELVSRHGTQDPAAPSREPDFLSCVGVGAVPDSLWGFVPAEAIGVFATSIDGSGLYGEVLKALSAAPGETPKALAELEARHGFSLERDLIGNLGGGAAAYMLPITGVITIPGIALVAELRDAERFQRGLDGLLRLLEEQASGEFAVRYKPYRDQPLWTFSFGGQDGDGPAMAGPLAVSPSFAIVQGHLIVTLTSLRAKKEIKRLLEEPGERHPLLTGQSAPPAGASAAGFMDWPSFIDGTYEGARAALSLMGGFGGEMPFDAQLLPAAASFTRFYRPTVLWSRSPAEGVRATRIESSFGPETWLGVLGGAGALALGVRSAQAVEFEAESSQVRRLEEDPERARAVEESTAALSEVATRLEVFRIDAGHYPTQLEVLLEPTPNFPRGYLGQDSVPADGWGRALRYVAASDGVSYSLWSLGENGEDERGGGDDVRLP